MPTEAFANTTELMKNVLRGLIESGAIKLQQAPTPPDKKSDDVKGVPRAGSRISANSHSGGVIVS